MKSLTIHGIELRISASIGISLYPRDTRQADELILDADKAMYAAKQAGKNRYTFFKPTEEV